MGKLSVCRPPQIYFYRGCFENKKRPVTSFQFKFFADFVTTQCLLPKFFSKICFVFHAWAFDNGMTIEYLKSKNLIISRTKRAL